MGQVLLRLREYEACQVDPGDLERAAAALDGISFASVTDVFLATVEAMLPSAQLYGEKTPRHLEYLPRVLRESARSRAVIVIRDPRAVYASIARVPWSSANPSQFSARWNSYGRIARAIARRFPDRVTVVRYEDFINDPDGQVAGIGRDLALEPLVTTESDCSVTSTFDIEREPWKAGSDAAVHRDSVDRWRTEISPSETSTINRATALEARLHGYRAHSPESRVLEYTAFISPSRLRYEAALAYRQALIG